VLRVLQHPPVQLNNSSQHKKLTTLVTFKQQNDKLVHHDPWTVNLDLRPDLWFWALIPHRRGINDTWRGSLRPWRGKQPGPP
jgi:hypothetical protein